ncbi:sulfotransferase family 2 domain-containing protein [Pseudoalteromonas gelatinilytica]|uniref:sulfotransferase family 2 domain-containing protein n=1 Tax=Pseudoalteromonas gelatinilytica TaxID=1703256 RepID=UPI0007C47476|nr:sulfotransferase family 2 domain-containing protein [Pseudoalteromonas gelatinilytica]
MFGYLRGVVKGGPLESMARSVYTNTVPLSIRDKLSREFVDPYSTLEINNKVIFVHIPKNAGNGIANSLFREQPKGHNFLKQYKEADTERYKEFFKFAFSRNPYSRFYSAYSYLKNGGFGIYDVEFAEKYIRPHKDFNSFILSLENKAIASKVLAWTHFIPQSKFILVDGINELDYLGSVEKMEDSLREICNRLDLEPVLNSKVNASNSGDYRKNYTNSSIELIKELYKEDLELLNYDFE